jgi:glutamate-ammonia-ligase adenylyltransferase
MQALVDAGHVTAEAGATLAEAYRFLRRLENRLQMLADGQTHALPERDEDRRRIADALGFGDWAALRAALDAQRARVTAEFEALLAPRRKMQAPDALASYWRALPEAGDTQALQDAGFDEAEQADGLLRDLARSPGVKGLSDATRARLDRVLPALLQAVAGSQQPMLALRRLLALLQNILRRSAYLALLDEQPAALQRLVDVVSRSALLAERLAAHPLLLDELLDARVAGSLPDRDALLAACAAIAGDDAETVLQELNEVRQALSFRIAMAVRDRRQPAAMSAQQLAWLADGVVARILALAQHEVTSAHGTIAGARFAVLGYGSLGGEELGFGSDLDLVFLYDAPPDAHSDGDRPLDATRWFARLAQKVVALLGAVTAAGRLYEVDVRLRPDGAKGLLVSSLSSFGDYQRERAWTWEHQALVRARFVAGDAGLHADFEAVRAATLARPREPAQVREDVLSMRRRMRAELDRSDAAGFDLKQGEGGLVDLEFLLQALVLIHAQARRELLAPRNTPGLIAAMHGAGLIGAEADALRDAHATLLARGLDCTLDRRQRRLPLDAGIDSARAAIREATRRQGLDFAAPT